MKFYIVKKLIGDTNIEYYYTGIDDEDIEFSTEKSDAETFDSLDKCWVKYELKRGKLTEKNNTQYYLIIDSMEG